jgi:hypothetical protein
LTWRVAYQEAALYARQERGTGMTLAEAGAFARDFATEVAQADNDTDNLIKHPSENPFPRPGCAPLPGCTPIVAHHFYSRRAAEKALNNAETTEEFGTALHAYQDTFSHWEKLGKPSSPGGIWYGHAQNDIYIAECKVNRNCDPNKIIDNYDPKKNSIDKKVENKTRDQIRKFLKKKYDI